MILDKVQDKLISKVQSVDVTAGSAAIALSESIPALGWVDEAGEAWVDEAGQIYVSEEA